MKTILILVLACCPITAFCNRLGIADFESQRPYIGVAGFVDDALHKECRLKIESSLEAAGIRSLFLNSPLVSVLVDPKYKAEAVSVLTNLVKDGGLDIQILESRHKSR